jgi:hypothetical protein
MLAELIDAVVGVDTHRDTHEVEIALPTGTAIGTRRISNDNSGFAELLAWIVDHAPGPRVVVSIEGTRSFGVGLARAVAAAAISRRRTISAKTPSKIRPVHRTQRFLRRGACGHPTVLGEEVTVSIGPSLKSRRSALTDAVGLAAPFDQEGIHG